MKHVGFEIKFYHLDTFKKQIDVNFIDLDSNLVDLNYKVASLIFCHFWRSIYYGDPQLSRENQKPHGEKKIPHSKTENLTAKTKTSRQNRKPHDKNKNLTTKTKYLTTKPKTSR